SSWVRSDSYRCLLTTERRVGVAKGFSGKKFLFCRILGRVADVIYRGDHAGGSMSVFTAGKPLDREVFDRLVGGLRPKLHRYCARMTGSVLDGEDVVHEAIVKAIEALSQTESIARPEAWLFRIAHNAALDFLRHRARQDAAHAEEDPDMIIDPVAV